MHSERNDHKNHPNWRSLAMATSFSQANECMLSIPGVKKILVTKMLY